MTLADNGPIAAPTVKRRPGLAVRAHVNGPMTATANEGDSRMPPQWRLATWSEFREVSRLGCRGKHLMSSIVFVASLLWSSDIALRGDELTTLSGNTMGTTYQVKFSAAPTAQIEPIGQAIERRLGEIDARMSTYRDDSEISRFNQTNDGKWFEVSDETSHVVARALEISASTRGAFDITVGPLVRRWNFGAASSASFRLPSDAELAEIRAHVGAKRLEVRENPPALRKRASHVELDLSAIAKGYGVDELADLLLNAGVQDFLVEIGGEMRLRGRRPDGNAWTVGIESPSRGKRELYGLISPGDCAVASSGDYRNFFEHQGTIYSHTIDPRTGRPVQHQLAAVTVLAGDCTTADALATALLVMGPDQASSWADSHDVAALLLIRDGEKIVERMVGSFQASEMTTVAPLHKAKERMSFSNVLIPALVIFGLAIVGMSIGVIVSNRRIKGSCGGLAGITDDKGRTLCDGCTNPAPDCTGKPDETNV